MALNTKVKSIMDKRKIGNKELSIKSGIPLRTVNNILSGVTENPTLETMRSIADALNCTLDDFSDSPFSGIHTIAAHFDGSEYTEEELEEIKQFAEFVKNKRR